jgi:hypothetical protein
MSYDGQFSEEREVEMEISTSMNAAYSAACAAFSRRSFEWISEVSE